MMSSPVIQVFSFGLPNLLHLAGVLVLALLALRVLRAAAAQMVRKADSATRAAQQREQQTRALADTAYRCGAKAVALIAVLTALPEFGISTVPASILIAAVLAGAALGARATLRDVIAGFQIVLEDQFAPGDTIQAGATTGRVEQLTLRRTLLRDLRGALVTIANGELRTVSNLSRDWSQAFVDVTMPSTVPPEKALQALEAAAAQLRSDDAWSQALVDGPRVLGVQSYDALAATMRLQVRTTPTRQDEVCRELRRRIQLEFQKQGIVSAGMGEAASTGSRLA